MFPCHYEICTSLIHCYDLWNKILKPQMSETIHFSFALLYGNYVDSWRRDYCAPHLPLLSLSSLLFICDSITPQALHPLLTFPRLWFGEFLELYCTDVASQGKPCCKLLSIRNSTNSSDHYLSFSAFGLSRFHYLKKTCRHTIYATWAGIYHQLFTVFWGTMLVRVRTVAVGVIPRFSKSRLIKEG